MIPDYATLARAAMSAATTAEDPSTVVFYLATARSALHKAKEEIVAVEALLDAREAEAARLAAPKQLETPKAKSK